MPSAACGSQNPTGEIQDIRKTTTCGIGRVEKEQPQEWDIWTTCLAKFDVENILPLPMIRELVLKSESRQITIP